MNVYNPTYACKFYKHKEGQWQRYTRGANLSFTEGNLTVRDEEQGTLLVDFPKAVVDSFDYVKTSGDSEGIVRINPSSEDQARERIAMSFERELVKSVMQELRRVAPVNVCHHARSASRKEGSALEMPSLSDPSVLDMILQLLFDDSFSSFTAELAGVLEEFAGKMDNSVGL
jgi:hypothetical protein